MATTIKTDLAAYLEDTDRHVRNALHELAEAHTRSDAYEVLRHVRTARAELDVAEAAAVALYRAWGASWAQIGDAYGISRQAAWERYSGWVRTGGSLDFSAAVSDDGGGS